MFRSTSTRLPHCYTYTQTAQANIRDTKARDTVHVDTDATAPVFKCTVATSQGRSPRTRNILLEGDYSGFYYILIFVTVYSGIMWWKTHSVVIKNLHCCKMVYTALHEKSSHLLKRWINHCNTAMQRSRAWTEMDRGHWKYRGAHIKKARRTNLLRNMPKYSTITEGWKPCITQQFNPPITFTVH